MGIKVQTLVAVRAVIRRNLLLHRLFQSQSNPRRGCGSQSTSGTDFPVSISGSPCQYPSTSEAALGRDFRQAFLFSLVSIIPQMKRHWSRMWFSERSSVFVCQYHFRNKVIMEYVLLWALQYHSTNKVSIGQDFLPVLHFSPINIISP